MKRNETLSSVSISVDCSSILLYLLQSVVITVQWLFLGNDGCYGYGCGNRLHHAGRSRKYDVLAYILLAMPFVYPLLSLARTTFPGITSPVMRLVRW